MQFRYKKHQRKLSLVRQLVGSLTLVLSWGVGMPATLAAETVTILLGPFQQSIEITELEKFAKTGKLPANLQLLSPVFTPQLREWLTKPIEVDHKLADEFIDNLRQTPEGKRLIAALGLAIPNTTVDNLQTAINIALRQADGLNALDFLRAYPEKNVTIDATKVAGLALEFNANRLQSQALGVLLEKELAVKINTNISTTIDPAVRGEQTVRQQTLVLQDRQRNRTIPVEIYWGQKQGQNPLVVISHGFGASRQSFTYLARHLASHGITVAAIEHPGSNFAAVNRSRNNARFGQLLSAQEFIARPKDITFLLDELAQLNTQSGPLQGKFNTQKVTVVGHSLGGYTALALIGAELDIKDLRKFCQDNLSIDKAPGDWLQCVAASLNQQKLQLKDERVQSAIAFNPLVGRLFGQKGLTKITKPVLILSSTEDAFTPAIRHQLEPFNQIKSQKYLLVAVGGTHLSVSDPTYTVSRATTIIQERQGVETEALRRLTQGVSLSFIKQQTPEAILYQSFLTPAYAQSLSTLELPLRLVSELPAKIKSWL